MNITVKTFESLKPGDHLLKHHEDGTRDLTVRVVCSAGTYVRTLAESLGKNLGVGAHLTELRRTRAGEFAISDATTLEEFEKTCEGDSSTVLLTPDAALGTMPFVQLDAGDSQRTRQGMAIPLKGTEEISSDGEKVRMRDSEGNLIAIGSYDAAEQLLRPRVVLSITG